MTNNLKNHNLLEEISRILNALDKEIKDCAARENLIASLQKTKNPSKLSILLRELKLLSVSSVSLTEKEKDNIVDILLSCINKSRKDVFLKAEEEKINELKNILKKRINKENIDSTKRRVSRLTEPMFYLKEKLDTYYKNCSSKKNTSDITKALKALLPSKKKEIKITKQLVTSSTKKKNRIDTKDQEKPRTAANSSEKEKKQNNKKPLSAAKLLFSNSKKPSLPVYQHNQNVRGKLNNKSKKKSNPSTIIKNNKIFSMRNKKAKFL